MSNQLNIIGRAMNINGNFRPKLLMMQPKQMIPVKAPIDINDVTHDASSIVIFPDGNGDSSDINKITLGLAQPSKTPNPIVIKFTMELNKLQKKTL